MPVVLWVGFDDVDVRLPAIESYRTIQDADQGADLVVIDEDARQRVPDTDAFKVVVTTNRHRVAREDELLFVREASLDPLFTALPLIAVLARQMRLRASFQRSLVARLAHEMSNPLTSLRLMSSLLLEEAPSQLATDLAVCSDDLHTHLALLVGLADNQPRLVPLAPIIRHASFSASHLLGRILRIEQSGLEDVAVYEVWPQVCQQISACVVRLCHDGLALVRADLLASDPGHVHLCLRATQSEEHVVLRSRQ